jgi:hypothetical protein
MNLYYSLEGVPELSGLGKNQRLAALMYYQANKSVAPGSRTMENALVGMVIFAEIAGLIGGFALISSSFWGPILGSAIAMAFVMCAFYFGMLVVEAPKFRRFLQEEHSQFLLLSLKMPTAAQAGAPAPREAESGASRYHGTDKSTPMREDQMAEALRRIVYSAARASEVMELSEVLSNETLQLCNAFQQKQDEAWRALRSLKLGKFLRLTREAVALRTDAFRHLRRSGELLQHAEKNLGVATSLFTQIEKNPQL